MAAYTLGPLVVYTGSMQIKWRRLQNLGRVDKKMLRPRKFNVRSCWSPGWQTDSGPDVGWTSLAFACPKIKTTKEKYYVLFFFFFNKLKKKKKPRVRLASKVFLHVLVYVRELFCSPLMTDSNIELLFCSPFLPLCFLFILFYFLSLSWINNIYSCLFYIDHP